MSRENVEIVRSEIIEDQATAFDPWTVEPEKLFENDDQVVGA